MRPRFDRRCLGGVFVAAWLVAAAALTSPASAGACTAVAVRIAGHPGYVRAVVDFSGGVIRGNQVSATDPQPMDGTASLMVARTGIRTAVPTTSGDGITVRTLQRPGLLRISIGARRGRFKYLAYAVVAGDRIVIDLWKSAPPSPAAEIHRGRGGCLTLDSAYVAAGTASASGRERNLFESQFQVVIRGGDGHVLARHHVHAVAGHWSTRLAYRVSRRQAGTLEAVDFSAADGALDCLAQLRVTLEPRARL